MIDPSEVAGMFAEAHATLEEAALHNYDFTAAFWAALDHLEGATADQAVMVAAVLAGWSATFLNPTAPWVGLSDWLENASSVASTSWAQRQ